MTNTNIPRYLESNVVEHGDRQQELLLCLVQAVEQQTRAIESQTTQTERIAEALEQVARYGIGPGA